MVMSLRALLWVVPVALWVGCSGDTCPPPAVALPSQATTVDWAPNGYASVPAVVGGYQARLILDTAFPQSALSPSAARVLDPSQVGLELGGAKIGPVRMGVLLAEIAEDGVLGADVLHQLPLRFDARARKTEVLPAFVEQGAYTANLDLITSRQCRGTSADSGPAGPFAFVVRAEVEGQPALFVLDTGAHATLVRTSLAEGMFDRARLHGVRVASGFAGVFEATATRARTVSIGTAESPNALIMLAPEIDAELDAISDDLNAARGEGVAPLRVDGLLGWSFLREFEVELIRGASADENRAIRLLRFDTQTHWTREFVGIGIYRSSSETPPGIRVEDFFEGSPAVGILEVGDVIVKVDGVPVAGGSLITSSDGDVELEVVRADAALTVTVPYVDLLPNPPAP